MKFRVVVKWKDGYANIEATRMEKEEDVVFIYNGNDFAGMFDLGAVEMIYRSGGKNET